MIKFNKQQILTFSSIFVFGLLTSCGQMTTTLQDHSALSTVTGQLGIQVSVPITNPSISAQSVSDVRNLKVTCSDDDSITNAEFAVINRKAIGRMNLKAGTWTVQASFTNADDKVLFTGKATVTIAPDKVVTPNLEVATALKNLMVLLECPPTGTDHIGMQCTQTGYSAIHSDVEAPGPISQVNLGLYPGTWQILINSRDKNDAVLLTRTLTISVDDTPSARTVVFLDQDYDDLARFATHNPSSPMVVIGRYSTSGPSYDKAAIKYGATYFYIEDWDDLSLVLGADNMWKVNEAFMAQQKAANKTFYASHDPNDSQVAIGSFKKELDYLALDWNTRWNELWLGTVK